MLQELHQKTKIHPTKNCKRLKAFFKEMIENFPKIANAYRSVRDNLDQFQPSILTPWGFTLAGNPLMASGKTEKYETETIRYLIPKVDLVVNIGANVGFYCLHAKSFKKPIIAIEPLPRNINYLLRNLAENGWRDDVEVYAAALSSKNGIVDLWGGGGITGTGASLIKGFSGNPESYVRKAPSLTLDLILQKIPSHKKILIIADIDGAEFSMLQGARRTLARKKKPIWILEITSDKHQPQGIFINPNLVQTFELFFQHGYSAKEVLINGRSIKRRDVEKVSLGQLKFKTQNFIFKTRT